MKILIPKIGTKLTLNQPWTFKLTDERRNEKFWLDAHGEPKKNVYYYDPNDYYRGPTSPTPTATLTAKGFRPADPIDTTIPAGTVLYIETFHIQKGHEPKIAFRIKRENKTKAPVGKFLATIDDVNKMEVESELISKYPNGRFMIRIGEGVDRNKYRCTCGHYYDCKCGHPQYIDRILIWDSDPDSGSRYGKRTSVKHRTDTAGLDEFTSKGYFYRHESDYTKSFDNLTTFLTWAAKKGCTQTHIDTFIKQYDPLRIEWEKSKA